MRLLLPIALLVSLVQATSPPQNYINTAIARTVELGGATTSITTQYNIKSLIDDPSEYWLALAGSGDLEPAWWEVKLGGQDVESRLLLHSEARAPTVVLSLGKLKKDQAVTLSVNQLLTHCSTPLPAEIAQTDPQYLMWNSDSTYVDSWYPTEVERIKIRSPTAQILSVSKVPKEYIRDSDVTKASGTVTLGPFHGVPPTLGGDLKQSSLSVHYETNQPIIGLSSLRRNAEVSHWGGNLNIQDEMALVNMGPKLKGFFSRLTHQQSRFHASTPAQIFTDLTIRLPPNAHSAYFYDTIGNVSTSHFRPGTLPAISTKKRAARTVDATLELKPRYPLLGGWNYSFVVGWDLPLGDALKVNGDKYVLAVPFLTPVKDMVIEVAELRIVLPEGARSVEVFTPFPVDSIDHTTHKTYLDSTGRHMITIRKTRCTEFHAQSIYVTYEYPLSALLQKPLTVAAVVGGLFVLSMGLRRVDLQIEKK
ncbi:hypothetical protein TREMEDRAFT_71088 [Tremella mesenterica DSM 1558]|uniref:uncharacterized protein n=1 Tax=Tremella mesenterica (strain ATCC 24925 / CBS 8224 / DSM 1558 / NBRC 9311 / NRRL Y-6157 / RJB 2259-6 / UBC 559-6) TaxID=578456 RepID=UPI0003F4908F|nr:uncharacterized protein TREMEDRAFT_71088 [Tremella mesenterica DSM 1558]EIW71206.1 hypothetical protein TREMEDRAFT_71088 [Tremella mesenterica DSM 1558]